jgi:Haem-binding uptake, Tiki superfamily, ChaN
MDAGGTRRNFGCMPNKPGTIRRAFSPAVLTFQRAAVVATLTIVSAAPGRLAAQHGDGTAIDFMRGASGPADYILSRFAAHRVVLLGEPHWVKHDAELLATVVPRLLGAKVNTLAAEWLPAREQRRLDALMRSSTWDDTAAMAVLRAGAWLYKEYLDVLHAAWQANRARGGSQPELRVLGLGPDINWREQLLPLGKTYDTFMADRVSERLDEAAANRILIALGFHHAFSRYVQPDLPSGQRATRFNDRTGNVLWRRYGEDVFMIVLHHPWYCRAGAAWGRGQTAARTRRCGRVVGMSACARPSVGMADEKRRLFGA